MRILIATHKFPSPRTYSWAKYWTIVGHDVEVLAQVHEEGTSPNPGFQVDRLPDSPSQVLPADLLISAEGPLLHRFGSECKKSGLVKKWVADVTLAELPTTDDLFPFFSHWKTRRLLRHCDQLIAPHHSTASQFQLWLQHDSVSTITDGFDPSPEDFVARAPLFPEDGKFRILYPTPFKSIEILTSLFSAISSIASDPFLKHLLQRFECILGGSDSAFCLNLASEYNVEPWVRFLPLSTKDKLLRALRDSHYILYSSSPDEKELPELFFESIASKTPLLLVGKESQLTSQERLLLRSGCGKALNMENGFSNFLLDKLPSPRQERTSPPADLLHKYSRKTLALKLLNVIS